MKPKMRDETTEIMTRDETEHSTEPSLNEDQGNTLLQRTIHHGFVKPLKECRLRKEETKSQRADAVFDA